MTAYDPNLSGKSNGLLRWLGLGGDRRVGKENGDQSSENGAAAGSLGWRDKRRRQLLEDIGSFLLTHRLEVSPDTLSIAYDVISGSNSKLTQLLEERILARDPITSDWLEKAAGLSNPNRGENALNSLMAKLETSIEDFGQTTTAARSTTTEYNSALETQVDELKKVSHAGVVITELAAIARVMIDRTRETMAGRRLMNRANDKPFGRITFSAGIADIMRYASPRDALKAADDALYDAKNGGRNKVLKATDDEDRQAA